MSETIPEDIREAARRAYRQSCSSHGATPIEAALMAEREAGGKAADDMAASPPSNDARHTDWQMGYQDGLMEFAAIRRGAP